MKNLLLFSVVIFIVLSNINGKIKVDPESRFFVDEFGRKRIYHGLNVIYKLFPFHPSLDAFDPQNSLNDEDLQNLQNWGFNFIRLYVPWEGLEPVRGEYNTTLLEIISEIVQNCAKYNISVLLDAHQDLYNRKFCGEGAPDWSVLDDSTFPFPIGLSIEKDSQGYPVIEDCLKKLFSDYYPTIDVSKAFQNLYSNADGIQDHFAQMWYLVAQKFNGVDNVLGYEILNEPWFGNIYRDPLLLIDSDKQNLQNFYANVNAKIRQGDNETIVFFEPCVADTVDISLNTTPGGSEYNDRQCFSYHVYCPLLTENVTSTQNFLCKYLDDFQFDQKLSKAKELGVASFLTEFGALFDNTEELEQIDYVAGHAEQNFQSWSYWQFKYYQDITTSGGASESFYTNSGELQTGKVKTLSRPYFYAICGNPVSTQFTMDTGLFTFSFIPSDCNGANSELFISEDFYYANSLSQSFEGCNNCQLQSKGTKGYYELIIPAEELNQQQITITLKP